MELLTEGMAGFVTLSSCLARRVCPIDCAVGCSEGKEVGAVTAGSMDGWMTCSAAYELDPVWTRSTERIVYRRVIEDYSEF